MSNLRRKLAIGFALGFAVFIGLILYGDIRDIGRLLQSFRWSLLPAILGLTMVNYTLRGVRFHYYLHQIGIKNISFWDSFLVFLGGFALTITPAKVGELIRVYWLKNMVDADPAQAATILGKGIAVSESMPFALYAFLRYPHSFKDCLYCAILNGGDRDTLGAMACAVSGAYLGERALPKIWLEKLENGKQIRRLAVKLLRTR